MTVAELIEVLKTMPQDARVVIWDGEWGKNFDIVSVRVEDQSGETVVSIG